jgi:hypothetical protein
MNLFVLQNTAASHCLYQQVSEQPIHKKRKRQRNPLQRLHNQNNYINPKNLGACTSQFSQRNHFIL